MSEKNLNGNGVLDENGDAVGERLAEEVEKDFLRRQRERKPLERSWQLNMSFVSGNQYCDIDASGEMFEEDKGYFWQSKRVFNHIAPIIDTRLSKLSRIRPSLTVRAASDDESDRHSAALASNILAAAQEDADLDGVISAATMWSEICGTAFYKTVWNAAGGKAVGVTEDGKKVREGRAEVAAVSPFEIYPYSLAVEALADQPSIIHAKALPVQDIYTMYGVKLEGRDIEEFTLAMNAGSGGRYAGLAGAAGFGADSSGAYAGAVGVGAGKSAVKRGYELVIERYERPTADIPEGRLTVVAGGRLLYDGELPYKNGEDGEREYPFVKQVALPLAGSFFGASVVDRLIPLQRAFNALKNRKHEFLNRIAMGTVAVEDGSVDVDELAEDGLMPGKIIVYRQGGTPPALMNAGNVPDEFWKEEEALISEFAKIAGTGDLSENADSFSGVTSATGLQLIIDQDDLRLNVTYGGIKRAVKTIGRHILRLYRQFAADLRLMKYAGENNALNLFYFKGSDISSDDVVLEADSDVNMTPAQRRTVIYEILDKGLFSDADGKISVSAKNKLLELLGYSSLSGERDLGELNRSRAGQENLKMRSEACGVKAYDDHNTHISEHTAFLLTEELTEDAEKRICEHMLIHKNMLKEIENDG